MCKYCRHLSELRNLDRAYYKSLIKAWQRTCLRQEKLLEQALLYLETPLRGHLLSLGMVDLLPDFIERIKKELRKDTVHD